MDRQIGFKALNAKHLPIRVKGKKKIKPPVILKLTTKTVGLIYR
jgi:hypothetical protein